MSVTITQYDVRPAHDARMSRPGPVQGASPRRWRLGRWTGAAIAAAIFHAAALALVVTLAPEPPSPPPEEPVILIDLAPSAAPVIAKLDRPPPSQPPPPPASPTTKPPPPSMAAASPTLAAPQPQPPPPAPIDASSPTLPPVPASAEAAAPGAVRAATLAPVRSEGADDPRAKKQEVDYFALVSAHLNRRKVYPVEARKARQQGVVTVRFTVDRDGEISEVSIKQSSGHALLDEATLELLRRVAPLPRMPASMTRERVTLALPIDYSLRTN